VVVDKDGIENIHDHDKPHWLLVIVATSWNL
jgi:hypothetical protein